MKQITRALIYSIIALSVICGSAFSATPLIDNVFHITDSQNRPVPGGKVYTYEPGTTTPKVTYSDEAGTIPHPNPVILNSEGKSMIYGDGEYTIDVKDMFGGQVNGWPKLVDSYVKSADFISDSQTKITKINTIADLRTHTGYSGESVQVLGYYTAGDGGGGPVRIWKEGASPGTYVDNGGSVIVVTGGDGSSAWLMSDTSYIVPEYFGAKGDGVNDDQAAFHAIEDTFPGGTINFTNRDYLTSYFPKAFSNSTNEGIRNYRGVGFSGGTKILYTGATPLLEATDTTLGSGGSSNGTMRDISFAMSGTPVKGLNFTRLRYWVVENVFTFGFTDGLTLDESWGTRFISCSFYNSTLNNVIALTNANGIDFVGCHSYNSLGSGWNLTNYNSFNIVGGITEGNAKGFTINNGDNLNISNHYLENNTQQFIIGWTIGVVEVSHTRIKTASSNTDIFRHDPGDPGRVSKLVVKDCFFADTISTSGKLITNSQGTLETTWKDNRYDFSVTELEPLISGFDVTSWTRIKTDEVIQGITLDSGVTLSDATTSVRLMKPDKDTVKVIGSIKEAGAIDSTVDINTSDLLLIPPAVTLNSTCSVNSTSLTNPAQAFVNTSGRIRIFAGSTVDLQTGVNIQIEYPVR